MSLAGKISFEIGVHATAAKWFNVAATQLHHVQNLTDRIHGAKLHYGDDWHHTESIKHWTYTIAGKVATCHESVESVDEESKTIYFKLFDGDIGHHYKGFKLIFETIDKNEGGAIVKWTIEYEKVAEEFDAPYDYVEFFHKITRDIDAHLLKA